jgi:hypothetical protein
VFYAGNRETESSGIFQHNVACRVELLQVIVVDRRGREGSIVVDWNFQLVGEQRRVLLTTVW